MMSEKPDLPEGEHPEGVHPEGVHPEGGHKAVVWVGTSGFSFPDWVGTFYPKELSKAEWLAYYARHFPALELNSSFYGIPSVKTMQRLCERTPPNFRFVVKANRKTTHESADAEVAGAFREALGPIIEAGRLHGVLAQFPWSFRNTPANLDYLVALAERTPDVQWFIEFRHRGWIVPEVGSVMREHKLGFVSVDEPQIGDMMPPVAKFTVPVAYVRLHGRNADAWWGRGKGAPSDRYDYLYTEDELQSWVGKIGRLAREVKEVLVFFNNCHRGQAADNANLMRSLLRELPNVEVL